MRRPVAAVVLCAAALLAAARARADLFDDRYYYEEIYEPFYVPDPARPGWLRPARDGTTAVPIEAKKPAGTLRVFIIGGSTAGGYQGDGDLSWGLAHALPRRRVEVVNCGMSGYDSFREQLVLEDVARYQPDIVLLLTGHNDFFIHRPPPARWVMSAARRLARFGWFRALQSAFRPNPSQDEWVTAERRSRALASLLDQLRLHIDTAERVGARPVVCVPPVDYAEMASGVHPPPWADADFSEGWVAYLKGDAAAAAAAWRRRIDAGGLDDALGGQLWHALGRAELRLGRREEARRAFLKSLDTDAAGDVCGASCLEAERRLARERGAVLADLDGAFVAAARGVPDADLFVDEIHWNGARHRVVTGAVVAALRADPALSRLGWSAAPLPPLPPTPRNEALHRKALLFFAVQRLEMRSDYSQRALEWLESVERLEPSWTATPEALLSRAQAVYDDYDPHGPGLHRSQLPSREIPRARLLAYYGAMRLEQGRFAQAADALERALALDPSLRDFRLARATALALAGRPGAALSAFNQLAADGSAPEAQSLSFALGLGNLASAPAELHR